MKNHLSLSNVGVGVGVIIINSKGQILIKKRKGSHAEKFSIPGGRVDAGETFEKTAIREIEEETGLTLINPKVIAVTNNLETYKEDGVHFISVILVAKDYKGKLINNEPEKCESLGWFDPKKLPQPHFDGSRLGVECFLENKFYKGL